ncbi:MAG: NADH-quinone oxidoreductase subunit J [Planctomycetes bacterium]|nr:NADH-quinone oxidoreductase subunit J [Planctomycetota bacterium]
MIALVSFAASAALAVVGALLAASVRNLLHAALLLGVSLFGTAGLYLFLGQPWLACVQVVVYIGGILVLILFATLFSSDITGSGQRAPRALWFAALGTALTTALAAWRLVRGGVEALAARRGGEPVVPPAVGSTDAIGDLLLGAWFAPFFLAGVLLTVALVAAVAIVQRHRRPEVEAEHA